MSEKSTKEVGGRPGCKPFVLKWAEESPPEQLWSERSVFSAPVNGLDTVTATEADHVETTGQADTADCTHT